ncbi:MAG: cytochrome b N-terminal domain-containing protein [Vicinamibacterales bacterium]
MVRSFLDWLDSRIAYRTILHHALDEPLPKGSGWTFTTGSVVTLLIGIQILTGVGLTMYYVPSPSLAYDSVRFITDTLPFGWMLRGLHFWGASFVVVAAGIHMMRVFFWGSYKAPREVTWLTGVVLLMLILGFSLSGYLLPWDQKAYWATTVTINVARSSPFIGEYIAAVLRGGNELGALTLGRWYSAHVFLLPGALITFIVAHILLLRKHGASGPIVPQEGPPTTFFPWHVMKDTVMMAAVFALLLTFVFNFPAHLDEIANPADPSYIPRPEWYFLSLFQLLKYFPGPLEPVGTLVIPGLIVGFLLTVPFLDRGASRKPFQSPRLKFVLVMLAILGAIAHLTTLGLLDSPARYNPDNWGPQSIAGHALVSGPETSCAGCHRAGGPAAALEATRVTKDTEWLLYHMADPVAIAPGVRTEADPAPRPQLLRAQAQSVVAYLRRMRAGAEYPAFDPETVAAAQAFATMCINCHMINGEGGSVGPDLSHVGSRRDAAGIQRIIENPKAEFPTTPMPAYGGRIPDEQIARLAAYLASQR